ncbi:hypothetical protein Tco_0977151 [Tanacetum coccineum]|uniref:Uncharacterized protein n=1 Tax=Tanacetum coccineum TaxID=301880 RepID=A0ABQ5EJB2_9ASTR
MDVFACFMPVLASSFLRTYQSRVWDPLFRGVILIGSISVEVLVAPEVGAAAVASPAGVLKLDTHSSLEADPSESSPPPISIAPMGLLGCSEGSYLRWRSASLSTMYPPTTSESSAGDSSFESSAGPSHKRCMVTIAATVIFIYPCTSGFSSFLCDLSNSQEIDATTVKVAVDRDVVTEVDVGIDMEVDVRVDVEDEVEDEVESNDRGIMEVGVDFWDLLI